AKLAVPTIEFFDNTKSFGKINRNLPQRMVALMQHSFLSPRDKYFNATGERLLFACIDEMQRSNLFLPVRGIENLEDGSPVKAGSKVSIPFIVKKDGSKWIPIFTDGLAVADAFHQNQQVIMDNFPSHCNVVTEQYSGFIINPGRGQMDFPKQWIAAAQNYWKKKNLCTQEVDVDGRKLRFGDLEQSSNTDEVTELLSNAMTKIKGARSAYLRYMWQPFAISYVLVIDTTEDELIIPEELRQINFSKFGVAFLDSVKFKSDISYITEGKEPFWKA
ncbi:MAG: SseB family protein, partial [Lachnospiraceae bacterium]|nr:SseB family protein [Lachnospiraceae bacterium]